MILFLPLTQGLGWRDKFRYGQLLRDEIEVVVFPFSQRLETSVLCVCDNGTL